MHRHALITLLEGQLDGGFIDPELVHRFLAFVRANDDCLLRTCEDGHITASAWIWSEDEQSCLLTHHRKLDRWLQLGGHVDGEPDVQFAALREAQEESGMQRFQLLAPAGVLVPLDLDVHPIPQRKDEKEHLHWDVRFLLRAEPGQDLVVSSESNALRWVERRDLPRFVTEESVVRLERRAASWQKQNGQMALRACPLFR